MNLYRHRAIQVRDGDVQVIEDQVAREERFRLFINGDLFTCMVASGDQLEELGAGFVVCQGLAPCVEGVRVEGNDIFVTAPVVEECMREIISTGSLGARNPPPAVNSSYTIGKEDVFRITREIETETWRKTGGVHASVLFCEGRMAARSGDVGRHNTMDKVIGHAVLNGLDRSRCVLGCTGRQPRDMVVKSARAGVPIVVSRAASTDRGILTAEETGITLVCFSREQRFTVYTHPERIRDLFPPDRC
ncbi:FdhD protein [Methanolinea mesophila]|uniref:formate dehydrogenase accessory sulfurtransferase FdhD n=1 Tax=Methanolinea mesophila TaxID=547055 RepID=UPI001AEA1BF0|nr:formate dehydrogenase accessory sulfurtransferase FdhD [Methanolinea mesophila]MBP1929579.1 FdhD protein [Methanolinea mesophila]